MYPEWSRVGAINYYNDRILKESEETQGKYYIYSENKNWDTLEKEQLIFEGDTLYYCVY